MTTYITKTFTKWWNRKLKPQKLQLVLLMQPIEHLSQYSWLVTTANQTTIWKHRENAIFILKCYSEHFMQTQNKEKKIYQYDF